MLAQIRASTQLHTTELQIVTRHLASQVAPRHSAKARLLPLLRCLECGVHLLLFAGAGSPLLASEGLRGHPGIHPRPPTKGRPTWIGQGSRDSVTAGECSAAAHCGPQRSLQHGLQRGGLAGPSAKQTHTDDRQQSSGDGGHAGLI